MSSTLTLYVLLHFCGVVWLGHKEASDDETFGADLITKLKNDANLDLSIDEEYEDLRAELLAYHTALASLTSGVSGRRSLGSTPCWELGGVCVHYKLCSGFRYLTEVHGCKDKLNVCCFTWNRFKVRDFRDYGIPNLNMPWPIDMPPYVGEGVKVKEPEIKLKKKKKNKNLNELNKTDVRALAYLIRTI